MALTKFFSNLVVDGAGGTVLDVQGSVGQLFSVTDSLTGDLFAVSDISGVPILNVNSSGAIDIDGTLNLGDNNKIQLGASQDLQLYHNGTHSYIDGTTNDLYIRTVTPGDDVVVQAYDDLFLYTNNGLDAIIARGGGAVEAYYNNSKKFETTNTGVTVTGNIGATNFSGSSSGTNTGDQTLPTLSSLGALSTTAAASTYLPLSGGTLYKATSSSGTSGTTFLTVHNYVGGDLAQQQSFIDFMFTDSNANFTPQVRIGAQVGRDADADAISKEGAGAFVVYTGDGTNETGSGSLTESFRVSYNGGVTTGGKLYIGSTAATTTATTALLLGAAGEVKKRGLGSNAFSSTSFAPLASPALTGTPTAPTAGATVNTTQLATTAFVQTAIANLAGSAPDTLNTLNELAAALGDDASFSTTVTNSIATKLPLAGGTMTGALAGTSATFSGQVHFKDTGNSNGGSILMGPSGSGTNKWSYLAGTHYNQDTGSGNGSGSAGVAVIGCLSTSTYNKVLIGGNPYEINPATQIEFWTHTATTHTTGGSVKMKIAANGNITFSTYGAGILKTDANGLISVDTATYITQQRAISSTPTDGATTTAISSDWAFDNVKTAVPANAVFTDTVNTFDGAYDSLSGTPTLGTAAATASTAYATSAQGTLATNALPKAGGTMTGQLITGAGGLGIVRSSTNGTIWFNSGTDTNHALWNAYYGESPTTRGSANTGFDGIFWNTYRGLKLRGGSAGAYNLIVAENSSSNTNDHTVKLYASNALRLETISTGVAITGDIKIDSAVLSNQENTDVDTGTETVATVAHATYTAAFFDFVIKSGTNVRAGTVYSCHDGTNVEFTETSTVDLGDTSDVTLVVDISGTDMRLRATTTSNNWSVKSLVRAI